MSRRAPSNVFAELLKQRSFRLERISPTTFPRDVVATHIRGAEPWITREAEAILDLVKSGSCFRCRIGKGRFFYSSTVTEAIQMALDAKGKK